MFDFSILFSVFQYLEKCVNLKRLLNVNFYLSTSVDFILELCLDSYLPN